MASAELALQTEGLSRTYGATTALSALDLDVRRGSLFALLGPNGAGKSTTIGILTTLLLPSSGSARVAGFDVVQSPREVRKRIGVVFQDPSLDDRLTARENLMLHAAIFGVARKERRAKVDATLAAFGLSDAADSPVRAFSGGMRRRLEIGRALLHEPEVLVLDEPTVGLDPQTRRSMWESLIALARSGSRTVFLTTHYMEEAARCDDVAIIDHGRLVARGTPATLVAELGREELHLETADDARAAEQAEALGYRTRRLERGIAVSGAEPEVMLAQLAERGLAIARVRVVRPTLEDAFVALTGSAIRDAADLDTANVQGMRAQLRARRGGSR
jgi:ABC-2 type transport system ATP-binding protein